ncbi:hypothetical protein [Companilactobacillus mishanensis]|uniref:hypothetical protein n=1 Tax=Companilactobacillus mishanensis TaxID=2486008 RepID=UPI000F784C15|nr:hypothetical protein [Companilactobacillus mishanensis]
MENIYNEKYYDLTKYIGYLSPRLDNDGNQILRRKGYKDDGFDVFAMVVQGLRDRLLMFCRLIEDPDPIVDEITKYLSNPKNPLRVPDKETELVKFLKQLKDMDLPDKMPIDYVQIHIGEFVKHEVYVIDFRNLMYGDQQGFDSDPRKLVKFDNKTKKKLQDAFDQLRLNYWDRDYFRVDSDNEDDFLSWIGSEYWRIKVNYHNGRIISSSGAAEYPLEYNTLKIIYQFVQNEILPEQKRILASLMFKHQRIFAEKGPTIEDNKYFPIVKNIRIFEKMKLAQYDIAVIPDDYDEIDNMVKTEHEVIDDLGGDLADYFNRETDITNANLQDKLAKYSLKHREIDFESVDVSGMPGEEVLLIIYDVFQVDRFVENLYETLCSQGYMLNWMYRLLEVG